MPTKIDDHKKSALLDFVALGLMSPAEAGRASGISRATAFRWVIEAGIDWKAARRQRVKEMGAKIHE